jgi:hypothetical protein
MIRKWVDTPESVMVTEMETGWGVFEQCDGIASPIISAPELRAVYKNEETANSATEALNESEGYIQYVIDGDPESGAYWSREFFTGKVAMLGATTATLLTVEYKRID